MLRERKYLEHGQIFNGKRLCLHCEQFHEPLYPCRSYPVRVKDQITIMIATIMREGANVPDDLHGAFDWFIEHEITNGDKNERI